MLIDYTYFEQDPTYIAGIDVKSGCTPTGAAQEIVRNVESCIRRYEPKFLRMLLGTVSYTHLTLPTILLV